MPKIQTRAGESLADQYDTPGSVAGVEELLSRDVGLFHEMGNVLLSERMQSEILEITGAAMGASVSFDWVTEVSRPLPKTPTRIFQIAIVASRAATIARAALYISDPGPQFDGTSTAREIPIFAFDYALDVETPIQFEDGGDAEATWYLLRSPTPMLQQLLVRIGALHTMPDIVLRGETLGSFSGVVYVRALILLASPSGGPQGATVGLPIPSW